MVLRLNSRANGACPICTKNGRCLLQERLKAALADIHPGDEMEAVVYSCGQFCEKS